MPLIEQLSLIACYCACCYVYVVCDVFTIVQAGSFAYTRKVLVELEERYGSVRGCHQMCVFSNECDSKQ